MIDDLLEVADHLARRDPGRPKQVSLRRAVSSAHYALFHALAALCADQLVSWRKPWNVFTPIYRSLDHRTAKRLFERNRAEKIFDPAVLEIGRIFNLLQERRHMADYDPEPFAYGRRETLNLIDQARIAIVAMRALPPETKLLLAVHLIAKPR